MDIIPPKNPKIKDNEYVVIAPKPSSRNTITKIIETNELTAAILMCRLSFMLEYTKKKSIRFGFNKSHHFQKWNNKTGSVTTPFFIYLTEH